MPATTAVNNHCELCDVCRLEREATFLVDVVARLRVVVLLPLAAVRRWAVGVVERRVPVTADAREDAVVTLRREGVEAEEGFFVEDVLFAEEAFLVVVVLPDGMLIEG